MGERLTRLRGLLFVAVLAAVLMGSTSLVSADVVKLTTVPTSDGTAVWSWPGGSGYVSTTGEQAHSYYYSWQGSGWRVDGLMQFPLASLSADTLSQATLSFFVLSCNDADLWYNDNSGTGTITYDNSLDKVHVMDLQSLSNSWVDVDVTANLLDALADGHGWATFTARYATSAHSITVAMVEDPQGRGPYITAVRGAAVPEPAGLSLSALGLALLARRRRR